MSDRSVMNSELDATVPAALGLYEDRLTRFELRWCHVHEMVSQDRSSGLSPPSRCCAERSGLRPAGGMVSGFIPAPSLDAAFPAI